MTTKKPSRLKTKIKLKIAKTKMKMKAKAKVRKVKSAVAKAMSEAQMMAMWQKAATPAEGHKRLEPIVGTFKTKVTFVMAPGTPPNYGAGISEHRWVLGGRWVEQHYKGDSMGMPFEGLGFTGYDNAQKKYVGVWMDTFGTGLMSSVGAGRPTDKDMRFTAEAVEPSGKTICFDCGVKITDKNRHSYEMWTKAPNGKRFRTMLVEYVRA